VVLHRVRAGHSSAALQAFMFFTTAGSAVEVALARLPALVRLAVNGALATLGIISAKEVVDKSREDNAMVREECGEHGEKDCLISSGEKPSVDTSKMQISILVEQYQKNIKFLQGTLESETDPIVIAKTNQSIAIYQSLISGLEK